MTYKLICKLALVSILLAGAAATSVTYQKTTRCGGVKYFYYTTKLKIDSAKEKCEKLGGMLASIPNQNVQDHIVKNIENLFDCPKNKKSSGYQEGMFIGLTDREIEGTWRWADNTSLLNYTEWENKDDNKYTSQAKPDTDYVAIQTCPKKNLGQWKENTGTMRGFICEKVINKTGGHESNQSPTDGDCYPPESSGDNTEQTPDLDDLKNELSRLLECLTQQIGKGTDQPLNEERNCPTTFGLQETNPVILFERDVGIKAAEMMMQKGRKEEVNVAVPGIAMTLTPLTASRERSSRFTDLKVTLQSHSHQNLSNSLEIRHVGVEYFPRNAVLVSAVLDDRILDDTGLFETYPSENIEEHMRKNSHNVHDHVQSLSRSSSVMSVSLFTANVGSTDPQYVSVPVSMQFHMSGDLPIKELQEKGGRKISGVERYCVYYDTVDNEWSRTGCQTEFHNAVNIRCNCNHTTAFAVMVSVRSIKVPQWEERLVLAMQAVGIVFLIMTMFFLLWVRKTLRKDRALTQINLTLALLLSHTFFVIGGSVVSTPKWCEAITFFSHLFLISSAMWMLNEGLVLYKKTCGNALNFDINKLRPKLFAIGWLVPAIYALLCVAIGMGMSKYLDETPGYIEVREDLGPHAPELESMRKYDRCWLSTKSYMVLGAVVPVGICLIVNIFFLFSVARVIWLMSIQAHQMQPSRYGKEPAKNQHIKSTFKAVALLLPVLGVPWVLAFFVNIPGAEVVFIGIHGILSGLQGLFLFVIYVVYNSEFRGNLKRKFGRSTIAHSLHLSTYNTTSTNTSTTKRKSVTTMVSDTKSHHEDNVI